MQEYLSQALGGPPTLLPTLLGLRLVTDLRWGRPTPLSVMQRLMVQAEDDRVLEFAPAICTTGDSSSSSNSSSSSCFARPTVQLPTAGRSSGSGDQGALSGISKALLQLQTLCCRQRVTDKQKLDRSGLLLCTPTTLGLALASVHRHAAWQLPGGTAGAAGASRSAATDSDDMNGSLAVLRQVCEAWPVPPPFRLTWRATCSWMLSGLRCGNQARTGRHAGDSMSSSTEGRESSSAAYVEPPVLWTGKLQLIGTECPTPTLRLLLVEQSAMQRAASSGSGKGASALPSFGVPLFDAIAAAVQKDCGAVLHIMQRLESGSGGLEGVHVVDHLHVRLPKDGPLQVRMADMNRTACLIVNNPCSLLLQCTYGQSINQKLVNDNW